MAPLANKIVVGYVRPVAPLSLITDETNSMYVLQKEKFVIESSGKIAQLSGNRVSIEGFRNSDRFISQVSKNFPDVLIAEFTLSSSEDIKLLERLRKCNHSSLILLIVNRFENHLIEKGQSLGVNGYLHQNYKTEDVKNAITNLRKGDFYVCPEIRAASKRKEYDYS